MASGPSYVAYTNGLGVEPGEKVTQGKMDDEEWQYHIDRGNIVIQGGPDDPRVLAARAAGESYEDPRDQTIADLQAKIAELEGGKPADVKNDKTS